MYATVFMLIFAAAVVLYGSLMYATGDRDLVPYRARVGIKSKADVKNLGLIVARVGLVMGAVFLVVLFFVLARQGA